MEQTEKAVLSEEMLAQINAAVSKAVGDSTATVVESVTAAMKKASTTPEQEREAKVVALKATIDRANKVQTWLQKHVEAVLAKQIKAANGESELQKGMYDVSNFASILCNVSYLQQSAEWEAAYEDDASPIPEKLQAHLEALAETFLAMAREEVGELVSASAERKGANKMLKLNTDALAKAGTEALAKAAKSAVDHVATIKKAISDHTDEANKACKAHADSMSKAHSDHVEKMTKMHKAHADDMSEHVGKLAKILGAEEAQEEGDNDPKPATVTETPNIQKSASGDDLQKLIAAEVAKAVATAVEKARSEAQEETLKALLGDEAVEEMLAKAKKSDDDADDKDEKDGKKEAKKAAEAGVGTRTPVVLSGAGAVVKVMPVAKSQDTPQQTQQAAVEITADVAAAALSGDTTAGLALMKSARPTEGVPVTVAAALGSVKR